MTYARSVYVLCLQWRKTGQKTEWKGSTVKCGETTSLGLWKFRGTLHVWLWRSYRNYWMYLGEYLVHAWLDLVTKLHKYTPFAYSWSTSEECIKWNAVCITNQESDINWIEQGFVSEGYCLKFSGVWANSTKSNQQVGRGKCYTRPRKQISENGN